MTPWAGVANINVVPARLNLYSGAALKSACGQWSWPQDQTKQMAYSRKCYAVANCLIDDMLLVSMRALQINYGKKQAQV